LQSVAKDMSQRLKEEDFSAGFSIVRSMQKIEITLATAGDATRLREVRLNALKDAPYAFGAEFDVDKAKPITFWQEALLASNWFFISKDGTDIGLIGIEAASADRGSDCWIFGWWLAAEFRGLGIPALILKKIDEFCLANKWHRQGLGVWPENERAISAYRKLGFISGSNPIPSRSKPGQLYLPMYRNLPSLSEGIN
jgi:GNAT superfamily N-acetyltransferase